MTDYSAPTYRDQRSPYLVKQLDQFANAHDVCDALLDRDVTDQELRAIRPGALASAVGGLADTRDEAIAHQREIKVSAAGRPLTKNQRDAFEKLETARMRTNALIERIKPVSDHRTIERQAELAQLPTIKPHPVASGQMTIREHAKMTGQGMYSDDQGHLRYTNTGRAVGDGQTKLGQILTRDQAVTDWAAQHGSNADQQDLSLGRMLRGWMTGRWDGADNEQRALLEGTQAGGGVLVPSPLSAQIIDRARNASRCFQAGARIVPMTSKTLTVPRIAGSPNPSWRAENATISEGDLTFDSIVFDAKSMALIVRASRELIEDGQDIDGTVERDLAAQVALELDRVMLRGTGTAPEPQGVRNTSGVTITAFGGANGAAPTNYDHLLDAVQVLRGGNFEPNGIIHNPRSGTTLSKLKTTDGQYLAAPPELAGLPMLSTNQVPANITTGTSADTTEIYVGDWSHLMLGMRTQLMLTTLTERYADVGQVAFMVWMRADVRLSQPAAFNVITGVRP